MTAPGPPAVLLHHYCTDEDPDGDIESVSATTALADLEIFAEHCRRSREIMAGAELDQEFGRTGRYRCGNGSTAPPASERRCRTLYSHTLSEGS